MNARLTISKTQVMIPRPSQRMAPAKNISCQFIMLLPCPYILTGIFEGLFLYRKVSNIAMLVGTQDHLPCWHNTCKSFQRRSERDFRRDLCVWCCLSGSILSNVKEAFQILEEHLSELNRLPLKFGRAGARRWRQVRVTLQLYKGGGSS